MRKSAKRTTTSEPTSELASTYARYAHAWISARAICSKSVIPPQISAKIAVVLGVWKSNTIIALTLLTAIEDIRVTRAICDVK